MTNSLDTAATIVKTIEYITIASADTEGQPWNTPVFTAFDEDLNFYWISSPLSQHSKNIATNNKVFVVLYDSTAPAGTGEGVYLQATAQVVDDVETATEARKLLSARQNKEPLDAAEFIGIDATRRLYKITPQKAWVNDVETNEHGKFVRDKRVEIALEELRSAL